ncbi:MAG: 3-methyl-2-oxobutanoate hydroxymethyltransferase [Bdellovibrionota bacterium]
MMKVADFMKRRQEQQKVSMVTCYDYSFAKIVSETDIDCLLIGDSLAMVMHGFDSTIHCTTEMIALHTAAVRRGAPNKFIVADMPFLSFRKGVNFALDCADQLMKSGANAVKIENVDGHFDSIKHLVESGIPVMGHLGLTPQSVHQLSGYRVQGKDSETAQKIIREAKLLKEAGCFSYVLECIPENLMQVLNQEVDLPSIGIGAGNCSDGQVLVMQDMLGMNLDFKPKFVRKFSDLAPQIKESLNQYHQATQNLSFPSQEESF